MSATTSTAPPGVPYSRDCSGVYPNETILGIGQYERSVDQQEKAQGEEREQTHQLGEEIADAPIRNVRRQGVKDKGPGQRVQQGLLQLVHFEMLVADALLVDPHSLDGQHAVSRRQPARVELVVGHDEEEDDAQRGGQAAVDQKHNLPGRDGGPALTGADRDAVGHQAAEDLAEAVEREPEPRAHALFALGIPLRGEEGEAWGDGGFEDAEEDWLGVRSCPTDKMKGREEGRRLTSDGDGAAKVGHGGEQGQNDAPGDHTKGRILGQWQSLQQTVRWILPGEVSKVKHAAEPLVVVALEANVFLDAHDAGVGQRRLVQIVEPVDDAEQGHQVPVDDAQEALVGGLVDFHHLARGKGLHRLVGIFAVLEDLLRRRGRGEGASLLAQVDGRHRAASRELLLMDCLVITFQVCHLHAFEHRWRKGKGRGQEHGKKRSRMLHRR